MVEKVVLALKQMVKKAVLALKQIMEKVVLALKQMVEKFLVLKVMVGRVVLTFLFILTGSSLFSSSYSSEMEFTYVICIVIFTVLLYGEVDACTLR